MMNWKKLRLFIINAFIPYRRNPGINVTAIITLGGAAFLAFTFLLQQFGFPPPDPVVVELGKAAFYAGIGRASSQGEEK